MTTIKSLILGSAAALVAFSGAQAADLPVKAKAVEYVKICSLYGAGFYYIPGTDTCIKIGGHVRADVGLNTGGTYDSPSWQGGANGMSTRGRDFYQTRARVALQTDTRTATEYGVVRTFSDIKFDWSSTRENVSGGFAEVDYGFLQFAGFTFGKAVSMFEAPWILAVPTISSYVIGASSVTTGLPLAAYTASFGNGVSGTISLEDGGKNYRQEGIWNTSQPIFAPLASQTATYGTAPNTFTGNFQAGQHMPDIVGNIRFEQAWGSLHFAGALHDVSATYYGTGGNAFDTNGHPEDKLGYAFSGAFELKNLPTGAGDSLKVDATYAKGAPKYVFGSTFDTQGAGRIAKGDGGTFGFAYILDGVFTGANSATGTGLTLSTSWGARAFYEHYWSPTWRTSLWGAYAHNEFGGADATMLASMKTAGILTGAGTLSANTTGDLSLNLYQVGTTTSWQPVKDLTFSGEFIYSRIDQNLTGTYTLPATGTAGTTGPKTLSDQNAYNGAFRVLRSF
jgi:hypothetical protein